MSTALIDGDIIIWTAAAMAQSRQLDELELTDRVESDVARWMRKAQCDDCIVCLSGDRDANFRKECYPLYKANRPDWRPELHGVAKAVITENYPTFSREILEADDCMGLLATLGNLGSVNDPVIVTIDKDLRQVPGWHLNPRKEDEPSEVEEEYGERLFLQQWASGDATDGYPGIKGVGPKRAAMIAADGVQGVLDAYAAKGLTLEFCLQMARCAHILTAEDWNPRDKRPILWEPPQSADLTQFTNDQ